MALAQMSLWMFLLATAAGILASMITFPKKTFPQKEEQKEKKKEKKRVELKLFAVMGLFLAVFDFVVETTGGLLGLWTTTGSVFALGFVPVEVFFIAFAAGVAYRIVFPREFLLAFGVASSLLIAVVGTGIESLLLDAGLLHYAGGWTSWHALAAYFATFFVMHIVNSRLPNS